SETENYTFGVTELNGCIHDNARLEQFHNSVHQQEQYRECANDSPCPEHRLRCGSCLSIRLHLFPLDDSLFAYCPFLIEADDISCWITKSRGHFGRVHTDRLHDPASTSDDRVDGFGYAVNHDVDQQGGFR